VDSFIIIDHHTQDPRFNLAAEEYMLQQFDKNVVFLYVNTPCVVIGKHQNAFDECQVSFCEKHEIQIIRRLSGGGTVFHGPGNLNFSFIKNGKDRSKLIDFKKHLEPVNAFLHSLEIPSVYSGRNDLLVNDFKVSGNAEHIYSKKNRVIHHGTLLFDVDLKSLTSAIAAKSNMAFKSHAVKSVRSRVNNLITSLANPLAFNDFNELMHHFLKAYFKAETYVFTHADVAEINALVRDKYQTWEWNFGYSPKFSVEVTDSKGQQFEATVTKGLIESIKSTDQNMNQKLQASRGMTFTSNTFNNLGFSIQF
jgi:lipoate---protein ligase